MDRILLDLLPDVIGYFLHTFKIYELLGVAKIHGTNGMFYGLYVWRYKN